MIGVQSFGLSPVMAADLSGTLRKLAEIGFDFIEPMLTLETVHGGIPPYLTAIDQFPALAAQIQSHGLRLQSVHVEPSIRGRILSPGELSNGLRLLHQSFGLTEFVVSAKFSDEASARFWGKLLRDTARRLAGTPCRVLYHNHDSETRPVAKGQALVPAMDFFLEEAAGEVPLELDIGWAGMYADEVEIVKRYASSIRILHLKDFVAGSRGRYTCATSTKSCFAPAGTGEIQTEAVLQMRHALPLFSGNVVIDQNQSEQDLFEDLRVGFHTIRRLLEATDKPQHRSTHEFKSHVSF